MLCDFAAIVARQNRIANAVKRTLAWSLSHKKRSRGFFLGEKHAWGSPMKWIGFRVHEKIGYTQNRERECEFPLGEVWMGPKFKPNSSLGTKRRNGSPVACNIKISLPTVLTYSLVLSPSSGLKDTPGSFNPLPVSSLVSWLWPLPWTWRRMPCSGSSYYKMTLLC